MLRTITCGGRNFLLLPSCKGLETIDINTIIRVEAIGNYSKLYFENGKSLVVSKVLRGFENALSSRHFIRIHRGHLINPLYIDQCLLNCGAKVILRNGDSINIAKRKKRFFLKSWQESAV